MKKYNRLDRHTILLGIIIPFLLFFISMNATYAYFTATATKKESTTNTAIIKISLNNVSDSISRVTSETEEGKIQKLVPGDTLNINGTLVNSGSTSCYVIIEFSLEIKKINDAFSETHVKEYYTFENSEDGTTYTKKEIHGNPNNYSTQAGIILKDGTRNFNLTYTFTGNEYGNEYNQATATYKVRAHALQTGNLAATEEESAKVATNVLMENFEYSSTKIYGNSIQDTSKGTPSPTNPVEIQSVGERTKNLINVGTLDFELIAMRSRNTYTEFKLVDGKTYTLSFDYDIANISDYGSNYFLAVGYGELNTYTADIVNKTYDSSIMKGKMVTTFVVPNEANGLYLSFRFLCMSNVGNANFKISNIQLEESDIATEFEPYGYKIPVNIQGKNLYGGTETVLYPLFIPQGTILTFSSDTSSQGRVAVYNENQERINYWKIDNLVGDRYVETVTITQDIHYVMWGLWGETSTNFQIELGKTSGIYEPYIGIQYVYLDEPLRKVGDVMDYLDLETGKVVRHVGQKVLNGTEKWYGSGSYYTAISDKAHTLKVISSLLPYGSTGQIRITGTTTNHSIDCFVAQSYTLQEWKSILSTHNMIVLYELATPRVEKIERIAIPDGATITVNSTITPTTFN